MILKGHATDQNGQPFADAVIEIKGNDFITLFSAETDETGYYQFDIPKGNYPFLTAVKDYGINYLEYWCQDIALHHDMTLDVSFDKLEVYGLHVFSVKGAGNSLMAYFRPMSLPKFQQGEPDIAPDHIAIQVFLDHREVPVITTNPVKEFAADRKMSAYLIQVDTTGIHTWQKLDIRIRDADGHYGMATVFNNGI